MAAAKPKQPAYWLADFNKKSLVSVRITGVNLQGTGQTGFLMFKKETFICVYTIECRIGNYRWVISKTLDDFCELYETVHSNATISARKKLLVRLQTYNENFLSNGFAWYSVSYLMETMETPVM